jgi:proteic killer suppression protein
VIQSYRGRDTEALAQRRRVKRFRAVEGPAREKLRILETAQSLRDLSLPGLRLEKLRGDRKGQYSIRVNAQYRLCFRWKNDGAHDVELTDYH